MPSDPSGVEPKGVLTRLAPDWFDDQAGLGGDSIVLGSGVFWFFFQFCLYNNATTGLVLKVYGVTPWTFTESGLFASFAHGPQGTFRHGCSPIRPDYQAPFGQIYSQSATVAVNAPNPFLPTPPIAQIGTPGAASFSYYTPFPMFIVPAGYSLCLTNPETTDAAGAFFWYQQANE